MTASEQILEYIDGTLDPIEEEQLFSEMASRADLRSELRQVIAIGDAVRSDREAFAPPIEVERALLAGLGLGLIGTGTASAVSAAGGVFAALKGVLPAIASFVLGASIAGGGVYLATRDASESKTPAAAVVAPAPAVSLPAPVAAAPVTEENLNAVMERPRGTAARGDAASARPFELTGTSASAQTSASGSIAAPDLRTLTAPSADQMAASYLADAEPAAELRATESDEVISAFGTDDAPLRPSPLAVAPLDLPTITGVSIEVRNQPLGQAFVDNNAREVARELTDESAISLAYRVDHRTWFSVETGRSRYTQVLMVNAPTDANGGTRYSRIEQEPNITWLGAAMRRTFGSTVVGAQPFWQGALAWGINHGPMVRGRLGLMYDLPLGLSLNGAVEASSLVYIYNGQPLVTGKYGLSLGVQFGL